MHAHERLLNPVFKISTAFGFVPVALGIVLRYCFVLTSTCLDLFHASQSRLSTKLPVQDSTVELKRGREWEAVKGLKMEATAKEAGEKKERKKKQVTALNLKP